MRIPLFSWLFLIPLYYFSLSINIFHVSGQCPGDQQSLLLQLKNSLVFDTATSKKLVKWKTGSDYCSWEGVSCKKGCVSNLDLSSEAISGGLDNLSSLFGLKSIENLNLAYNFFNYTQIPSEFKQLTGLSNLNLSNAGFAGQVPIEISHLTRLVTLDLSTFYFPGTPSLNLENPKLNVLLANFSELVELYLDGVNISAQGTEWCQAISSSLPKLRVLSLSTCNLSGPIYSSLLKLQSLSVIRIGNNNLSTHVPEFFSNFPNLTSLRMVNSGLHGAFPKKIFQVPTLQIIDLSDNAQLQGSLPEFPKKGSLRSLVLNGANFSGQLLPNSIGNLKFLSKIDIANCSFTGSIPKSIEDLTQLVYLDLATNKFNGSVPSFSMAKNLTLINLSYNQLKGQINSSHWENLTNLVSLNLRHNLLNGTIPPSVFSLPMLQKLQLSNNQFSGHLHGFANNSVLDTLDLSSNKLEGPIPVSIFNFSELKILSLSSNNFSGTFLLNSLQQLRNLSSLDLSYNSLLINYDSSRSSFSSYPHITTLKLASGKLGVFPDFLRYQSQLRYLDLSLNQIHGEVPNWIWRLSNLSQLNLSCNFLVTLPGPFPNLTSTLSVLDLHSNQLQGQIPMLPRLATYLDYSRNNFSSSIPADIGDFLMYTMFFSLSSNKLNGSIPKSMCKEPYLQVLDLSNNSLSGPIPQCLTTISGTLAVLNLRRNRLSGSVPDGFPQHCSLRTLDLNENQIEGRFPKSLGNCGMLEVLNIGNNQIRDTYPCLLKQISSLRVLVLRSNRFYGLMGCHKISGTWPKLQIVDIARNNFNGEIRGRCLRTWKAMIADESDAESKTNHLRFQVLKFSQVYYQDAIAVTNKGLEMELVKILTVFTYIDISCNNFSGQIPAEVGELKSLYGLNLSNNALTGTIPPSLGNLRQLESLDLSNNSLSGQIPVELGGLTFLSFMDVSYNQLVGKIPFSTQISTFPAESFAGNKGLCGPPSLLKCSDTNISPNAAPKDRDKASKVEFDWQSIYTGVGYGVGGGVVVILLMVWEEGRNWLEDSIDKILLVILPMMGYSYRTRDEWDDDEEDEDSEEESTYIMQDYSGDEIDSEDRVFRGPYCVFCSKLDISRKRAIHNPNCTCSFSPPITSFSSSSYSFTP
ncbi:receptor-like protein 12 [Pyrus ussuriensis x Pyrus communis]|uniref:Receptor-like protein 12 n=1 Tax=Pyrus ussuriensis x Pyrus communis TaxID=2448454 RepID=A0A5N5HUP9_9ROSA|nr:receptor-like protein 12 [Pyrus ussuriensis x Pyrus communis]